MQTPALQFYGHGAAVNDLCRPFRLRHRNHGGRGAGLEFVRNKGWQGPGLNLCFRDPLREFGLLFLNDGNAIWTPTNVR